MTPNPKTDPKADAAPATDAAPPTLAVQPEHPFTLAIDVGGTGLKASVLDAQGKMIADRVRVETPYPLAPTTFTDDLAKLVQPLPRADRVSVGFPGVVRRGHILTAPHFVTEHGPGTKVLPELVKAWTNFDAVGSISSALGLPTKVLNDADLQGLAVISGTGVELVITFGTGVGSALFSDGHLAPHLELAQHPLRGKDETYNDVLGEVAFEKIGPKRWRRRALEAIETLEALVHYDRLYLGGGNSRHLTGHVEPPIEIVDNVAGILGGIKLWADDAPDE
jgi:polyphosphate glucokinase